MAEETPTESPKGKKKGKKLTGGKRVAVFAAVGVGAFLLYRWYQNRSSSSTSSTATPTGSSGAPAGSGGGYTGDGSGGGGYGGGGTPNPTTTTTTTTPGVVIQPGPSQGLIPGSTPSVSKLSSATTPIGSKAVTIAGQSYQTIAGFTDNATGNTYLGIQNPQEARKLENQGITLVHNPNDPNGKGLFILVPKGQTAANYGANSTADNLAAHSQAKSGYPSVATGTKTGSGAGYTGGGAVPTSPTALKNASGEGNVKKVPTGPGTTTSHGTLIHGL